IIPVYNTYWKIQDTFESVTRNMTTNTEQAIMVRLPDLLKIKYLMAHEYPEGFMDNIELTNEDEHVVISSHYHVTVWLLGIPQGVQPDEEGKFDLNELKGMNKLRVKARIDYDFEPYAETP
ncbi:MAG: hypothetical protein R8M38_00005, partial [Mariprofundaceae bacterium]